MYIVNVVAKSCRVNGQRLSVCTPSRHSLGILQNSNDCTKWVATSLLCFSNFINGCAIDQANSLLQLETHHMPNYYHKHFLQPIIFAVHALVLFIDDSFDYKSIALDAPLGTTLKCY